MSKRCMDSGRIYVSRTVLHSRVRVQGVECKLNYRDMSKPVRDGPRRALVGNGKSLRCVESSNVVFLHADATTHTLGLRCACGLRRHRRCACREVVPACLHTSDGVHTSLYVPAHPRGNAQRRRRRWHIARDLLLHPDRYSCSCAHRYTSTSRTIQFR